MLRHSSIVARGVSPCRAQGGQTGAVVTEDTPHSLLPIASGELTTFKPLATLSSLRAGQARRHTGSRGPSIYSTMTVL